MNIPYWTRTLFRWQHCHFHTASYCAPFMYFLYRSWAHHDPCEVPYRGDLEYREGNQSVQERYCHHRVALHDQQSRWRDTPPHHISACSSGIHFDCVLLLHWQLSLFPAFLLSLFPLDSASILSLPHYSLYFLRCNFNERWCFSSLFSVLFFLSNHLTHAYDYSLFSLLSPAWEDSRPCERQETRGHFWP